MLSNFDTSGLLCFPILIRQVFYALHFLIREVFYALHFLIREVFYALHFSFKKTGHERIPATKPVTKESQPQNRSRKNPSHKTGHERIPSKKTGHERIPATKVETKDFFTLSFFPSTLNACYYYKSQGTRGGRDTERYTITIRVKAQGNGECDSTIRVKAQGNGECDSTIRVKAPSYVEGKKL
jgi:hypothetical protein